MNIKCLLHHTWDGCICKNCGLKRDQDHSWDGCICSRCGAKRDTEHTWVGCICSKCGAENHDYEVIEKDEYTPSCCYSPADPCTGPNCGTWCDSYPGPGYSYTLLQCRRCGKREERGQRPDT